MGFSVVGSSERSDPKGEKRLERIILPGLDHPVLEWGWRLITGSGVGIGPTAFSVGCRSSGGLVCEPLLSPASVTSGPVKCSSSPRCAYATRCKACRPVHVLFWPGHRGRERLVKPRRNGETPKGKLTGKLISGCTLDWNYSNNL